MAKTISELVRGDNMGRVTDLTTENETTVITITIKGDIEESNQTFEDFGVFMGKNIHKAGFDFDIKRVVEE
tara:strand:+ start:942 stop:1154 length:213 start_codon:yes stop_codon:yes gene_type:complete